MLRSCGYGLLRKPRIFQSRGPPSARPIGRGLAPSLDGRFAVPLRRGVEFAPLFPVALAEVHVWPFKQKKRPTVSTQDFTDAAWEFMRQAVRSCYLELEAAAAGTKIRMNAKDQIVLSRELIIAHLWATSKAISSDCKVLESLHDRYFMGHYNLGKEKDQKAALANAAQAELLERYHAYYKTWEADEKHTREKGESGFLTASEMLQRFFPRFNPVMDVRLSLLLQTQICAYMASLLKFRDGFTINGA